MTRRCRLQSHPSCKVSDTWLFAVLHRQFCSDWKLLERLRPEEIRTIAPGVPTPRTPLDVGQGGPAARYERLARYVGQSLDLAHAEFRPDSDAELALLRADNWMAARTAITTRFTFSRSLLHDALQYLEAAFQCGRDMAAELQAAQTAGAPIGEGIEDLQEAIEKAEATKQQLAKVETEVDEQVSYMKSWSDIYSHDRKHAEDLVKALKQCTAAAEAESERLQDALELSGAADPQALQETTLQLADESLHRQIVAAELWAMVFETDPPDAQRRLARLREITAPLTPVAAAGSSGARGTASSWESGVKMHPASTAATDTAILYDIQAGAAGVGSASVPSAAVQPVLAEVAPAGVTPVASASVAPAAPAGVAPTAAAGVAPAAAAGVAPTVAAGVAPATAAGVTPADTAAANLCQAGNGSGGPSLAGSTLGVVSSPLASAQPPGQEKLLAMIAALEARVKALEGAVANVSPVPAPPFLSHPGSATSPSPRSSMAVDVPEEAGNGASK